MPNEDYEQSQSRSYGWLLRSMRNRRGISQEQLADMLGLPTEIIGKWELGKVLPNDEQVVQFGKALGVSMESVDSLRRSRQLIDPSQMTQKSISSSNIDPTSGTAQFGTNLLESPVSNHNVTDMNSLAVAQVNKMLSTQLKDVGDALQRIDASLNNIPKMSREPLSEVVQNASDALLDAKLSLQQLSAPVTVPTREAMQVDLVPYSYIQSLKEYQSDENVWFAGVGATIGAMLGVLTNTITGGEWTSEALFFLILLLVGTILMGWRLYVVKERIKKVETNMKNSKETNTAYMVPKIEEGHPGSSKWLEVQPQQGDDSIGR